MLMALEKAEQRSAAKDDVIAVVRKLLATYEFHMHDILDSRRYVVPQENANRLWKLKEAINVLDGK